MKKYAAGIGLVLGLLIMLVNSNSVTAGDLLNGDGRMTATQNGVYTLNIQATNGTVVKDPDKAFYTPGETVRLISRPASGYMFESWNGDVSGTRLIADLVMDGNKEVTAKYKLWEVPFGIPEPAFGVRETYRMYDNGTKRNPLLTYYQNSEGGYYTHYVDNSHPNATDSKNAYGTADKPRMTFPKDSDVLPGSVIELHGGAYQIGQKILKYQGTAELPIFLRGYSNDVLVEIQNGELVLNSQYLICENIKKVEGSLYVRSFMGAQAHHVAIRSCDTLRASMTAVSFSKGYAETETVLTASDVVYYANHIDLNGFDPEAGDFPEKDTGGIALSQNSENLWMIDNLIHHATGDAIGGGHACKYSCKNVFIGRNVMHTCGENAIDVKEVDTVISSENVMYHYRGWSGGSGGCGGAVVFHYGPKYSPRNVWFMYNEIFDCDLGIQVGGSQEYPVHIIGNTVHDIHQLSDPGKGYGFTTWSCRQVYLQGNLFYDVDNGVDWRVNNVGGKLILEDNIVTGVTKGGSHLNISARSQADAAVLNNNTFYEDGQGIAIKRGGLTYQTAEEWNSFRGKSEVSSQNPGITDPLLYKYQPKKEISFYYYGDMNSDGIIDITDISFIARSIGLAEGDSGWDRVEGADINDDGMISITDLSAVARIIQ